MVYVPEVRTTITAYLKCHSLKWIRRKYLELLCLKSQLENINFLIIIVVVVVISLWIEKIKLISCNLKETNSQLQKPGNKNVDLRNQSDPQNREVPENSNHDEIWLELFISEWKSNLTKSFWYL